MQKPNEYDNAPVQGDFSPVELGGHYMVIKEVEETKSQTGKQMIKVCFDFAPNDKQPGYFTEQFKNDIRPDKKWSNQATWYTLVYDNEGKTSRSFKTFCTSAERSNNGFKINWGDNWGAQFQGKKIGGVFGIEHDFYDGKERTKRVLRWFCSLDKVDDAEIPKETETKAFKNRDADTGNNPASDDGFVNVPEGIDSEVPFN